MKDSRYYNLGWFGRHPLFYEIGSYMIRPIRRWTVSRLGSVPLNVLDVATGTGAQAYETARKGHSVTGVDLDEEMLKKASPKCTPGLSLSFLCADATALPFADHSYDAVTISFAMHDVPHGIGLDILKECRRVLKEGGKLVIVDYNELSRNPGAWLLNLFARLYESPNYAPFVRLQLKDYFDQAGFQMVSKNTFLGAVQLVTAEPVR